MGWRRTLALLACVMGLFARSGVAEAGCNTIPDGRFAILAPRGSVNSGFVYGGARLMIDIAPEDAKRLGPGDGITPPAVTISIVFKPASSEVPHTLFIAGNNDCSALPAVTCCLERLFCPDARECLPGSAVNLAVSGGSTNGVQVEFDFPETEYAGPVAVAVTPPGYAPLGLEGLGCGALIAGSADEPLLAACIDELGRTVLRTGPGKVAVQAGDSPGPMLTVSNLMALASDNDFRAVCSADNGEAPNCVGDADTVSYTVNGDGSVFLSVNWRKILKPVGGGPALQTRQVRGSSAIGAFVDGGPRIVIPSAQFLISASKAAWSFAPPPVFTPEELPSRPYEVTLFGTSDKKDSVLQIHPRVLWSKACSGGTNADQACEASTGTVDCPGTGASCAGVGAAYYACAGGARDKLPCTRPQHCPGGSCGRGTACYQRTTDQFSGACTTDANCGPNQQCGKGLFEFRNRITGKGVGTLSKAGSSASPGVCDRGKFQGIPCGSTYACNRSLWGPAKCVRYRGEAIQFLAP